MPSEKNPDTLLSFNFLLVTVTGFIFFFNFHALLLLSIHIKQLGGSETVIGLLMGTAALSTLVSTPTVGYLGDKIGKKIFVIAGLLLLSGSTLVLITVSDTGPAYYTLRFLHGLAFSMFFISAGAIITDIAPESKRAQAVGLYGVFTIINYALAPYAGRIIIENYGFSIFFILTGIITLSAVPFGLLIKTGEKDKSDITGKAIQSYAQILSSSDTLVPALTLFATGAAFIPTLTFIPVFSETIGISSFDMYFITYTVSVLFVRIFFGWLPDSMGKGNIARPALLLFSASIFILGLSAGRELFILSAFMFGIAHGFLYPSLYSIIIDSVNDTSRTRAFAVCSLSFTAGGMAGTFTSGYIADIYGYAVMYFCIAAVVFTAFAVFSTNYYKTRIKSGL